MTATDDAWQSPMRAIPSASGMLVHMCAGGAVQTLLTALPLGSAYRRRMSQPYEHILTARRDGTGGVCVDVKPPRNALHKQCVASLWENSDRRPSGSPSSRIPITPEQARELLAAGAEWSGPAHLKAYVVPEA
jgi:hypothetical protein